MGSIAEFPNAHICIQKSELLSWYEAFGLPPRFAHLTAIVDPDNIRSALVASIAHRVTLIDRGQKQRFARHSRSARKRIYDRSTIRGHRDQG
jgi:hypothetical protein